MASYNDEQVLSKLSALNETQEGIMTAAQWIMFHRRSAKRTAELWLQRLKESTAHKKLNLIYLANEVVQQSKARRKIDFVVAFSPIIPEACEIAYKGAPPEIQNKIKRVIQVWRERSIFEVVTQGTIEKRLDDVDHGKSGPSSGAGARKFGGGGLFGGSLGGGSLSGGGTSNVPLEFTPIINSHKGLQTKLSSSTIAVGMANTEYQKQFDTDTLPVPPVYAARLSSLLKTLDNAHIAVKGAIEAREAHIRNLEKLLQASKKALEIEKDKFNDITEKRQKTESTKVEVEMMILRDMEESKNNGGDGMDISHGNHTSTSPDDLKSPEIEALTPPHQISFEPPPPPSASEAHHQHSIAPAVPPEPHVFHQGASELLASLSAPLNGGGLKREKREDVNMFEGLDDDVADMFRNDAQMSGQSTNKRMKIEDDDEYHP
ncbi:uncharacterized protein LAJ45_02702 [Morchella importuna]|uniref:DUF618-domain-containing protein n=1 Tax=Morchella conica CCBAS932 TaxID=1392247 RepID=A0A3N4KHQ9_9PEZI|nr:uncharacterized protein LAJ45_02702 [Morchella importuna]KAH8153115.1 hypothetical protein LAJ45_02702 [Morchella importuna]RPB08879.1 DUF618-domain-containing protein [Morchella conica CCBAS932]